MPASLGKYRISEVLGEGAMGVVYKGFDPGIQRTVALKTVRRQLMEGTEFGVSMAARFRNEAQAAGRLSHPGIVAVYDYGEDGDVAYIAMEFVEGNSLAHYLANKVRFSDTDIASVVSQLLEALEHAHSHGVWHRDIKPANIIMTRSGRIKVADFGIARIESAGLTMVGSMIGTPSYMAPEQFLGLDIDRRVDIYGAGVLLYQLLVGRAPFTGSTESLMYRVVHEAPVLPSAVPGYERGARYDAVVATALAKDPKQRFAGAAEFRQALLAATGQAVAPEVSDETIIAVPTRQPVTPAAAATAGSASSAASMDKTALTRWDDKVLAQVEATLARHVGPVAAVMVRRTARSCEDLPSLLAQLAEQVTNPGAKAAFVQQTTRQAAQQSATGGGTQRATAGSDAVAGSSAGSRAGSGAASASGAAAAAPIDDAIVAQATKLLAQHIGPIASVLVKRSAARAPDRLAFFGALTDAVPDAAAREQLRAALARLA
ncbi:MAG: serine/threonine-protein kinase [Rubrivivax sp.]|nr:serine/threonine-protein kinase [Rubrivivax sp.]